MGKSDTSTWIVGLDRAVFYACSFWVGLQILPAARALGSGAEPATLMLLASALTCQFGLFVMLAAAARRRYRPHILPGLVLGWAGLALSAPITWIVDPAINADVRLTVPVAGVQALQIWALVTTVRFRTAVITILLTGPVFLVLLRGISWETFEVWLIPTVASTTLAALLAFLRSGSRYATDLEVWDRQVRQEAAAATARATAQAAARRVIHDDVISALRAVGSDPRPAGTARACNDAIAALSASRSCTTQEELVAALREATALDIAIETGDWPDAPAHVLDAFRGAAAEALRNVERHAGVEQARLRLRPDGSGLLLEVEDDGCGVGEGTTPGFGLRSSVTERMALVNGEAAIEALPTGGTRVRLAWQPATPPSSVRSTPYTAVGTRRGYLSVALPVVLGNSFLAWRYPGDSAGITLALAATCAVLVLATAIRFAHRPPTAVASLWVTLAVVALTAVGLANVGAGGVVDYRGWVIGFAADLTMFLAFHLRPRHLALPVLAQTLVIAYVAAADPTVALPDAFGALITPLSIGGVACVIGSLLRRTALEVRRAEALLDARIEEHAWQVSASEARRIHLASLRRELTPFLATAPLQEPSAEITTQAAVLAARCRDQLHLGAPLPEQTQKLVDAARQRGCTVSFRVGDEPVTWDDHMIDVLGLILTEARPDVVTLVPGTAPHLACLPPVPDQVLHRLAAYDVASDAVRTVVRLSSDRTSVRQGARGPIPVR